MELKLNAKALFHSMTQKQRPELAQLFFSSSVLNKYRLEDGYRIIRTDTSGRLSKQGGMSVDFGITGETDEYIHIPAHAWVYKVPQAEQEHWLNHLLSLPMSENYLRGMVRPGCIDDGPIRNW